MCVCLFPRRECLPQAIIVTRKMLLDGGLQKGSAEKYFPLMCSHLRNDISSEDNSTQIGRDGSKLDNSYPKDPAVLKTLRVVNHYRDSTLLPR